MHFKPLLFANGRIELNRPVYKQSLKMAVWTSKCNLYSVFLFLHLLSSYKDSSLSSFCIALLSQIRTGMKLKQYKSRKLIGKKYSMRTQNWQVCLVQMIKDFNMFKKLNYYMTDGILRFVSLISDQSLKQSVWCIMHPGIPQGDWTQNFKRDSKQYGAHLSGSIIKFIGKFNISESLLE